MTPKLLSMIRNREISKQQIGKDIIAGIIVAIIALPLSIALGISSGVTPEKGLITAIFAGFVISFLGGSKVQIGGPTGAFVVIIYSIIQQYSLDGLIISTIMAGIMLIIMGVLRFGSLIKYIPKTITIGFTTGIAVTLLSTQIKDLFGLKLGEVPAEFIEKWKCYFENMNSINIWALVVGLVCIAIILIWPKINKVIPGSIIAILVAILLVKFLNLPVETIGSKFGEISSSIPKPSLPSISIAKINQLFTPAMTIAILAALESLLSAVVADGMIDDTHDSNMELVAQGAGNILSGLFGGIPATGAIARTVANVKSGGKSPISGMVHAIMLLLIMFIFMPFVKLIPMTALAAILAVVSYNMSEWRAFKALLKAPKSDIIVLLITFLCTVIFDLVVAIGFGMIITMFLFMKRISETTEIKDLVAESVFDENTTKVLEKSNDKILVYQVNGPLFFGVVQNFMNKVKEIDSSTEVLILDLRHVHAIDASAIDALKQLYKHCERCNVKLILTHLQEQPEKVLNKMGLTNLIGDENMYKSKVVAIEQAYKYISN